MAVAFAVVLPLLLPSLAEPVFRRGSGAGDGAGSAEEGVTGTLSLNPFVSLKRDYFEAPDRVVVSYRTDAPVPDYLRTVTLNRFTGTTWEPDEFEVRNDRQVNGGLPPQVDFLSEQASLPVREYRIRIGALEGRYLPTPYPPLTVTIGAGWYYDPSTRTVFSDGAGITGTRYTATAVEVDATPDRLRKAPPIVSTAVGSSMDRANIPRSVELLARQVVGDAPTAYDQAVALQDWFRSEFRYSTTVRSGNDADYLEQFLRERVGYCEQFAATMALMARTLGIPARVAIGFAQGERDGDSWNLTLRDAHAWPELWFAGTGWIRFEPTPQGEGGGVSVPAYATAATSPTGVDGTSTPGIAAPGGAGLQAERIRERELARDAATDDILDVGGTGDAVDPAGDEPWRQPLVLALLGVLLAGAAVPSVVRAWRRRRRLADRDPRRLAEGAWAELRDTCIDLDLPWSDAASPRATAAALRTRVALDPAARRRSRPPGGRHGGSAVRPAGRTGRQRQARGDRRGAARRAAHGPPRARGRRRRVPPLAVAAVAGQRPTLARRAVAGGRRCRLTEHVDTGSGCGPARHPGTTSPRDDGSPAPWGRGSRSSEGRGSVTAAGQWPPCSSRRRRQRSSTRSMKPPDFFCLGAAAAAAPAGVAGCASASALGAGARSARTAR